MDYDKILVLDKGKVEQFDTPFNLINTEGIFKNMCLESNEFEHLVEISKSKLQPPSPWPANFPVYSQV